MALGEKICRLRKSKGMTQAELGEKLGVTYQAVSKWERNESLPDFDMMSKLAKLCGVSITYFEADGELAAATQTSASESKPADDILGFCTECGKVVRLGEESENSVKLVCKSCEEHQRKEREQRRADALKQAAETKRRAREQKAREDYLAAAPFKRRTVIASIVAGIIAAVVLILGIVGMVNNPTNLGMTILGAVLVTVALFTWVFQLFWDGWVRSVTLAGAISLRLPGIIFTMDLDGLIFLVVMKVLLWLLSALVAIAGFLITSVVAMIISPFTFIPHLFRIKRCDEDIL